jgi:hypothetical protein
VLRIWGDELVDHEIFRRANKISGADELDDVIGIFDRFLADGCNRNLLYGRKLNFVFIERVYFNGVVLYPKEIQVRLY